MKIGNNYVLQTIAGEFIVVPIGEAAGKLRGILKLNETGAFLWTQLTEKGGSKDDLTRALCMEYGVESITAKSDVDRFLNQLQVIGVSLDE